MWQSEGACCIRGDRREYDRVNAEVSLQVRVRIELVARVMGVRDRRREYVLEHVLEHVLRYVIAASELSRRSACARRLAQIVRITEDLLYRSHQVPDRRLAAGQIGADPELLLHFGEDRFQDDGVDAEFTL